MSVKANPSCCEVRLAQTGAEREAERCRGGRPVSLAPAAVLSGDARTSDLAFLTMRMQEALAGIQSKLLLVSAAAA